MGAEPTESSSRRRRPSSASASPSCCGPPGSEYITANDCDLVELVGAPGLIQTEDGANFFDKEIEPNQRIITVGNAGTKVGNPH